MRLVLLLSTALCVGCSTVPTKVKPFVTAIRVQNTETRKHIRTSREHIEKSQLDSSAADEKLESVKNALDELLK